MQTAKRLVLGIEGGGTKTEWIYIEAHNDERTVVKQGSLPAANLKLITDDALGRIFEVLPADATHVGVFLAGCTSDADRSRLRALAESAWPKARVAVGSDRDSGFATCF